MLRNAGRRAVPIGRFICYCLLVFYHFSVTTPYDIKTFVVRISVYYASVQGQVSDVCKIVIFIIQ